MTCGSRNEAEPEAKDAAKGYPITCANEAVITSVDDEAEGNERYCRQEHLGQCQLPCRLHQILEGFMEKSRLIAKITGRYRYKTGKFYTL